MELNNKIIEAITNEIKEDYIADRGDIYPNKDGKCRIYTSFLLDTKKFVVDSRPIHMVFDTLENISYWHFSVSQYMALTDNGKEAEKEFISALAYAYLYMKKNYEAWVCIKSEYPVEMDTATMMLSQIIIANWGDESTEIGDSLIESVNFVKQTENEHDKIIGIGTDKSTASWFILGLYAKATKQKIDYKNISYPQNMPVYVDVLKKWDTKDTAEIQQLIYLLSELHLTYVKELQGTERYYYEFGDDMRWLFPYEILVWLKLREHAGLKNPKTFTHPLMNTPIAKMFLAIKEPLPKPTELPYAKELLEKLKEKCPDVEIPQWLETSSTESGTAPIDDMIPEDFFRE